jgi:hypothetical protein
MLKKSGKMQNKNAILFGLVASLFVLSGCTGQTDNVFGEEKAAPDEFAVYSRAPLSLPPDFGLRPPKPGATRPQTVMPRNEAKEALLSNSGQAPAKAKDTVAQSALDKTPGVRALLTNTGADQANPDIRNIVNNETAALSGGGDENFADSILFWRNSGGLKGAVIDPAVEARRMRIQKSEGEVVEETPTPKIQRRGGGESRPDKDEKGFWGSLFD